MVKLYYPDGSGQYHIPVYLDPNASLDISLKELILSHHPDPQGNVIPESVQHGSATFANIDGETLPMDLVASVGVFNVKTATCVQYCVFCDGFTGIGLSPSTFNLTAGGTVQLQVKGTFHNEHNGTITQNQTVSPGPGAWGTSNSNVATVSGSGLVTAVAGGTTTITASGVDYTPDGGRYTSCDAMCPPDISNASFQATGTVKPVITSISPDLEMIGSTSVQLTINGSGFGSSPTVNLPTGFTTSGQASAPTRIVITVSIGFTAAIGSTGNNITVTANGQTSSPAAFTVDGPTHMVVEGDTLGRCSGCSTAVARFVTYQIVDFSGTNSPTLVIGEAPTTSGWSCSQQEPGSLTTICSSNPATATNGVFQDEWSIGGDVFTPSGCGFAITDHWQWCAMSPPHTFGTLTGYIHTDAVSINGSVNPPNQFPIGTPINP